MSKLFLQTNPKEKRERLQQLLDWGYIDQKEADSMYKQYCLIFGGDKMRTCRVSTERLQFGSPNWKLLKQALDNADIYWFLTDPVDDEQIAVKVFKSHKQRFLEIAKGLTDTDFHVTDY